MHRSKTQTRNPSFSSTLLDEIYNSIDPKPHKTQPFLPSLNTKKQSITVTRGRDRFFGSMSSSSDSNSSLFSSSDTELTHAKKTSSSRPLCFGPSKTKPRKTEDNALFHQNRATQNRAPQNRATQNRATQNRATQNRATRVSDDYDYASDAPKVTRYDQKKLKTPASPGVRLVNFINSLFSHNSSKQSSSADKSHPRKTSYDKQTDYYPSTTCSSASSFSRSCLNNKSSEKSSDRIKRNVKFDTVTVIVPESRSYVEEEDYLRTKSVKKSVEDGGRRSVEEIAREFLRDYHKNHENSMVKNDVFEDYEDDDVASDSSSDLFELDVVHHNLYGDELPVYETTFAGFIL